MRRAAEQPVKAPGAVTTKRTQSSPPPPPPDSVASAKLVVYPFPVRPDVFAELKLPSDLTVSEARRMGRFLEAVALSETDDVGA
jgi:hypothetical protein